MNQKSEAPEICTEHKKWTKEDGYKMLWTDESKFEQFGNKRRVYVRRREGKTWRGQYYGVGAISASGTGDSVKTDGIIDTKVQPG